jgi:glycine dehydrogenase subunit 1
VSLGLLEPPGKLGADIVTGEAQSFGMPPSFGGPFLGFMACSKEFVRQFPGRIAGETVDLEGKRGFVLTLSTREQHIRRERATSNICTNQALCALRATIFLETLGKESIRELAWHNIQKSNFALEECTKISGINKKFNGPFFNEFVLRFEKPIKDINLYLKKHGIIGGLDLEMFLPELENCALFCVTEVHTKDDIDRLIGTLKEALNS